MKAKFSVLGLTLFLLPIQSWAQNAAGTTQAFGNNAQSSGLEGKFSYYITETYLNPSVFTAPAFRAGIRMANPPGKGATQYPPEWRQGTEAFGETTATPSRSASRFRRHVSQRESLLTKTLAMSHLRTTTYSREACTR